MNARDAVAVLALVVALPSSASAWDPLRSENRDVREGNELMSEERYGPALEAYDRAAEELPKSPGVQLNRGLALLGQEEGDQAKEAFLETAAAPGAPKNLRADAYYDLGVVFARHGDVVAAQEQHEEAMAHYREAVDAFKRSLRIQPGDRAAAWNLEYALKRIREQEERQQEQEQNQEQNQEENEGQDQNQEQSQQEQEEQQNQQQEQEQNQEQNQEENEGQDQNQEQEQEEQQNQQQADEEPQDKDKGEVQQTEAQAPEQMNEEQVERFLDALEQNEESLPVQRARRRGAGRRPPEKDW